MLKGLKNLFVYKKSCIDSGLKTLRNQTDGAAQGKTRNLRIIMNQIIHGTTGMTIRTSIMKKVKIIKKTKNMKLSMIRGIKQNRPGLSSLYL